MKSSGRVLVVEDEPDMRLMLQGLLETEGYETSAVADGVAAITLARQRSFDVAVVDLVLPGLSGAETIRQLKSLSARLEVIIVTGHPSLDTAIGALHERVFAYLLKPGDMGRLGEVVREGVRKAAGNGGCVNADDTGRSLASRPASRNRKASPVFQKGEPTCCLVGSSAALSRIRAVIAEVGPTDLTVLIRGETGTGKEVVARSIHACSGRQVRGPFTKINCPTIPDHLFESEMFGHEKGSFTGAVTERVGRLELGAGGTVLLDEIGAISLDAQAKLLEVIEHKEFARLGGRYKIHADIRLLGATNAPLEAMIEKGQFRSDLLYRLQQCTIIVPPLREHREDIPELFEHFRKKYTAKFGKQVPDLDPSLMMRLCDFSWPGNVRQLDGIVAHYCVSGEPAVIEEALVSSDGPVHGNNGLNLIEEHEIAAIKLALSQTRGNQRRAASLLGLSYGALRRRIEKYELAHDK